MKKYSFCKESSNEIKEVINSRSYGNNIKDEVLAYRRSLGLEVVSNTK